MVTFKENQLSLWGGFLNRALVDAIRGTIDTQLGQAMRVLGVTAYGFRIIPITPYDDKLGVQLVYQVDGVLQKPLVVTWVMEVREEEETGHIL